MLRIEVNRFAFRAEYTIGRMYLDGVYFCDTLEDAVRDVLPDGSGKIPGRTAIPEGTYKVIYNVSPKFGRKLPRLVDVPHFTGILIHRGNDASDTSGCILVGENKAKGKVLNSTKYEVELCRRMAGETDIEITIKNKR